MIGNWHLSQVCSTQYCSQIQYVVIASVRSVRSLAIVIASLRPLMTIHSHQSFLVRTRELPEFRHVHLGS